MPSPASWEYEICLPLSFRRTQAALESPVTRSQLYSSGPFFSPFSLLLFLEKAANRVHFSSYKIVFVYLYYLPVYLILENLSTSCMRNLGVLGSCSTRINLTSFPKSIKTVTYMALSLPNKCFIWVSNIISTDSDFYYILLSHLIFTTVLGSNLTMYFYSLFIHEEIDVLRNELLRSLCL